MPLPITLASAAAAALINVWLTIRVGKVRMASGVHHGDGGEIILARRIRAQLNNVENTAFVLALIAALELSGHGAPWLALVATAYMLARIAHGVSMDADTVPKLRVIGFWASFLIQIGLALAAAVFAFSAYA